jgi:hypothetical protein
MSQTEALIIIFIISALFFVIWVTKKSVPDKNDMNVVVKGKPIHMIKLIIEDQEPYNLKSCLILDNMNDDNTVSIILVGEIKT